MSFSRRSAALSLTLSLQLFETAYSTILPIDFHSTGVHKSHHLRESEHQDAILTRSSDSGRLDITVYNNDSSNLHAYVTGISCENGNYLMLMKSGDDYVWNSKPSSSASLPTYYTENDISYEISLESQQNTTFYLPDYALSGRIYVSEDRLRFGTTEGDSTKGFIQPSVSNPSLPEYNISFQFIEFTYQRDNLIINLSNMDFVSVPLGMSVVSSSGRETIVGGLPSGARKDVCANLTAQAELDNYPWDELCQHDDNGQLVRVLSPTQYIAMDPSKAGNMTSYYDDYVGQVWGNYTSKNLTINIQDTSLGNGNGSRTETGPLVDCRVIDDVLACSCRPGLTNSCPAAAPYTFTKPSTTAIFGCTQDYGSPFAVTSSDESQVQAEIVPRLCAAFHRSTFLIPNGDEQPNINISADKYYSEPITNHYARIVHAHEKDGMGYAFAYDDTNPIAADGQSLDNATANAAGVISLNEQPELLFITVEGQ